MSRAAVRAEPCRPACPGPSPSLCSSPLGCSESWEEWAPPRPLGGASALWDSGTFLGVGTPSASRNCHGNGAHLSPTGEAHSQPTAGTGGMQTCLHCCPWLPGVPLGTRGMEALRCHLGASSSWPWLSQLLPGDLGLPVVSEPHSLHPEGEHCPCSCGHWAGKMVSEPVLAPGPPSSSSSGWSAGCKQLLASAPPASLGSRLG